MNRVCERSLTIGLPIQAVLDLHFRGRKYQRLVTRWRSRLMRTQEDVDQALLSIGPCLVLASRCLRGLIALTEEPDGYTS